MLWALYGIDKCTQKHALDFQHVPECAGELPSQNGSSSYFWVGNEKCNQIASSENIFKGTVSFKEGYI